MNVGQVTIQGNTYRLGRKEFIVDLMSPCFHEPLNKTFDNEKETFEWVASRLDEEGIKDSDAVKIRQYTYLEGEPSPSSSRKIELNGSTYTFRSEGRYKAECYKAGVIDINRPDSHPPRTWSCTFPTEHEALNGLAEHCYKDDISPCETAFITNSWYLSIEYYM